MHMEETWELNAEIPHGQDPGVWAPVAFVYSTSEDDKVRTVEEDITTPLVDILANESIAVSLQVDEGRFTRAPKPTLDAGIKEVKGVLPGCGPFHGKDISFEQAKDLLSARYEEVCGKFSTESMRSSFATFIMDILARVKQLHGDTNLGATTSLPLAALRALPRASDHAEQQAIMLVNCVPSMAGALTHKGARDLLEEAAIQVHRFRPRKVKSTTSIEALSKLMGIATMDLKGGGGLWSKMPKGVERSLPQHLRRLHTFVHVYSSLFESWTSDDPAPKRRVELATTKVGDTLMELIQHAKLVGLLQFHGTVMGSAQRTLCAMRDALLAIPGMLMGLSDLVAAPRSKEAQRLATEMLLVETKSVSTGILHGFAGRLDGMSSEGDRNVLLANSLKALGHKIGEVLRLQHTSATPPYLPSHTNEVVCRSRRYP